jgi:trimeric autotransporter adhesin
MLVVLCLATALAGCATAVRADAQASLVKQINTAENADSSPAYMTALGSRMLFGASDGVSGYGLWLTDGTNSGTRLAADIFPGGGSASPQNSDGFGHTIPYAVHNGSAYFLAFEPAHGSELWKSDGTAAGTLMVADINPGPAGSVPQSITTSGSYVFFVANDGTSGRELWRSDGTAAGTIILGDINPGAASSNPRNLTDVGGTLFFTANDGAHGRELWKSDGTPGGTVMVKDICPGPGSAFQNQSNYDFLVSFMGKLYFTARDCGVVGNHGRELWVSDGTDPGTMLVKDITPGINFLGPMGLTVSGDGSTLYFADTDGVNGTELWKSDGTALGTSMLADINPGSASSSPTHLTAVGSGTQVFFIANDGTHGTELWGSNGTTTTLLADINPGGANSNPTALTDFGGTLYFGADDGSKAVELWKSDGTPAGTQLVAQISPPGLGGSISNTAVFNGALYFQADDGVHGRELWRSDGTGAGTSLLKDINQTAGNANANPFAELNGHLLFSAFDNVNGNELWTSDGTTAGTSLVTNIVPGLGSSNPAPQTFNPTDSTSATLGNRVIFSADDGVHGAEPWVTDGTAAGTTPLADINPGSGPSSPQYMTTMGGAVYFVASDGTHPSELWRTDGTPGGTTLVTSINACSFSFEGCMVPIGSTLYFTGDDGSGPKLWRTDGTPAGTSLVSAAPSQGIIDLVGLGGTLYFDGCDANGCELWRSDGTGAGTTLVKDINPGAGSSQPYNLTPVGNTLFFTANDGTHGNELWASDGTPAGTSMVLDINPNPTLTLSDSMFQGQPLAVLGNKVVFFANDGLHGFEPWVSDGTAAGTMLLADIYPGIPSSMQFDTPTTYGNRVYFDALDPTHGDELWSTDGTPGGTQLVDDISPGPASSSPQRFFIAGGVLYFEANDGTHGTQLWRLGSSASPPTSVTPITTPAPTPTPLLTAADLLRAIPRRALVKANGTVLLGSVHCPVVCGRVGIAATIPSSKVSAAATKKKAMKKPRAVTIGTTTLSIGQNTTVQLGFRLNATGRRALKAHHTLTAQITLTAKDATGHAVSATARSMLTPAKQKTKKKPKRHR